MAGPVAAVIFVVVAAIVFTIIYVVLPFDSHFFALLAIGVIAIVFGLVAYFLQALSADASVQRAVSWGFGAMGFATLFLAVLLPPTNSVLTFLGNLVLLLVFLVLLVGWLAGIGWRSRVRAGVVARQARRAEWDGRPAPNAFSYHTAGGSAPPSAEARPPAGAPPPGAT
ncbi:MAG TPA: hypothetical protein VFF67_09720 [Thermoplasmata archaeon]|nr:hypothetical protein [Thermoplasmata archaeon]